MSRFFGYHYLAQYRPEPIRSKPDTERKTTYEENWDRGALLIVAIVALPVIAVAAVALLLAM